MAGLVALPATFSADAGSPASQDLETAASPEATAGDAPPDRPEARWRPPTALSAQDHPNDEGHGLLLGWTPSLDDASLAAYEIWRVPSEAAPESDWIRVGVVPRGTASFVYEDDEETTNGASNPKFVETGRSITLRVRGRAEGGTVSDWSEAAAGTALANWFHKGKTNKFLFTLLFGGATVWFIRASRLGRKLYVREIPGVVAVDEAIGRATEMGRPILFVSGTGTASDIASIAAFTILARIAKKTADYQTPLRVPLNDPVMMAVAQETVREAYLQAGRPEAFRPETVFYISAMQFPYVAAVNGLMLREKTATNFYMGVFHAESLLLAEAGSTTGAIQISGTDQVSQIPFFVAATDYTLIGEELYAASASLSQDPKLIGPLKAQDYAKVLIMTAMILGVAALSAAALLAGPGGLTDTIETMVRALARTA